MRLKGEFGDVRDVFSTRSGSIIEVGFAFGKQVQGIKNAPIEDPVSAWVIPQPDCQPWFTCNRLAATTSPSIHRRKGRELAIRCGKGQSKTT
jgi:hypothetical protein